MKRSAIILLLSFICLASATTDRPINAELAKHALVVMRAKKTSESKEADKYRWYTVQVIEIFENRAEQVFPSTPIKIAALSSQEGIPNGISTLYIERYNDSDKNLWKLVGGSASTGVSHNSK